MARRGSPLPDVTELIRNQLCRRPETVERVAEGVEWTVEYIVEVLCLR